MLDGILMITGNTANILNNGTMKVAGQPGAYRADFVEFYLTKARVFINQTTGFICGSVSAVKTKKKLHVTDVR